MNRNIEYKQVCRLVLNCNDDLLKSRTSSQYSCTNTATTNSKRIRFSLNNSLSDVILSQNAKCVLESCHARSSREVKAGIPCSIGAGRRGFDSRQPPTHAACLLSAVGDLK